jgi:transcriptional regulator with XRE-family HTH domain
MHEMGYKIKEFREKRGLTQEELAEKSGVSRTTIHALETDDSKNATTGTLLKLANALGTTVEKLFFGKTV